MDHNSIRYLFLVFLNQLTLHMLHFQGCSKVGQVMCLPHHSKLQEALPSHNSNNKPKLHPRGHPNKDLLLLLPLLILGYHNLEVGSPWECHRGPQVGCHKGQFPLNRMGHNPLPLLQLQVLICSQLSTLKMVLEVHRALMVLCSILQ